MYTSWKQNNEKLCLLLSCFFYIHQSLFAAESDYGWVRGGGGVYNDRGSAVATDKEGNIIMTGHFQNTATFGTITLTSAGSDDIFIAKYDASGHLLWAKRAGGINYDQGCGIATDQSNNIILTGKFQREANFDTNTLTGTGYTDAFIVKYNAAGEVLWARQLGSNSVLIGNAVTADASGNILVTGEFDGRAAFGDDFVSTIGKYDIFIVKYDAMGSFLWGRQAGGTDIDHGFDVATDEAGNCYVTGDFQFTATFTPYTVTSNGQNDVFMAKYNALGSIVWVKRAGGATNDRGSSLTMDLTNNILITGYFMGTADFGTMTLTSEGYRSDVFLAKFDQDGNVLYAKRAGGANWDHGNGVAVDRSGNALITGYFEETAGFGSTTLQSAGSWDIFIAKYDMAGNELWANRAGGEDQDEGISIATDISDNWIVTGYFKDTAAFGTISILSFGSWDAFVARSEGEMIQSLKYEYAPIFFCGLQQGLQEGNISMAYQATFVLIHNPNDRVADVRKKIALTYPPGKQKPGKVSKWISEKLGPDEALEISCNEIQNDFFKESTPASVLRGNLVIQSSERLDVRVFYSVTVVDKAGRVIDTSMDVEHISGRPLKDEKKLPF